MFFLFHLTLVGWRGLGNWAQSVPQVSWNTVCSLAWSLAYDSSPASPYWRIGQHFTSIFSALIMEFNTKNMLNKCFTNWMWKKNLWNSSLITGNEEKIIFMYKIKFKTICLLLFFQTNMSHDRCFLTKYDAT